MTVNVNQLTQEEFDKYLENLIECAFREGALWQKCGGENFTRMTDAIESAKDNIIRNNISNSPKLGF